jgi:hypothetical protein
LVAENDANGPVRRYLNASDATGLLGCAQGALHIALPKRLRTALAAFEYCRGTGFLGIGSVGHADTLQAAMRLTGASNAVLSLSASP